jgi:Uma2 family endonuclease
MATIIEQDGFIHSPPQLVAEVLAPGEDLNRKLADYASLGVPEVWVVSSEARTVEVLTWKNGRLHVAQTLSHGAFTSPHYPQVTVSVEGLWTHWRPQQVE